MGSVFEDAFQQKSSPDLENESCKPKPVNPRLRTDDCSCKIGSVSQSDLSGICTTRLELLTCARLFITWELLPIQKTSEIWKLKFGNQDLGDTFGKQNLCKLFLVLEWEAQNIETEICKLEQAG